VRLEILLKISYSISGTSGGYTVANFNFA